MSSKHIIIVGGGVSGLAAGWFLKKHLPAGVKLTILDAEPSVGGHIRTIKHEGFLFEQGPHSWRAGTEHKAFWELIEDFNLHSEIITAAEASKNRYLLLNKRLQKAPKTMLRLIFSRFGKTLFKAICKDLITPKGSSGEESIKDFISRRFGAEVAETFIDPMISGIWAGDIAKLSARSAFPRLKEWEQTHKSLLIGMLASARHKKASTPQIGSFKNGMETLINRLAKGLDGHIHCNARVIQITKHQEKIKLQLLNGQSLECDHLVLATPAYAATELFESKSIMSELFLQIPSEPIAVVNVAYKSNLLQQEGFGYLVPSNAKEKILGVLWDSSTFPQQNDREDAAETRLTVMLGGSHFRDISKLSEEQILSYALDAINRNMGIDAKPSATHIRKIDKAIPQYLIGHQALISSLESEIKTYHPNLHLLGSSFYGISVIDCIENAKRSMNHVLTHYFTT